MACFLPSRTGNYPWGVVVVKNPVWTTNNYKTPGARNDNVHYSLCFHENIVGYYWYVRACEDARLKKGINKKRKKSKVRWETDVKEGPTKATH